METRLVIDLFGACAFFLTFFTSVSYLGRVTIFAWLAQVRVRRSDYVKAIFWCFISSLMIARIF